MYTLPLSSLSRRFLALRPIKHCYKNYLGNYVDFIRCACLLNSSLCFCDLEIKKTSKTKIQSTSICHVKTYLVQIPHSKKGQVGKMLVSQASLCGVCRFSQWLHGSNGEAKLSVGEGVSVQSCLSLCISPVRSLQLSGVYSCSRCQLR